MPKLEPIPPPQAPPPRHSRRPLPAYRHVPGRTPHPVNDPGGHSHGVAEPPLDPSRLSLPDGWRDCEPYLYGVDLFNRAYFWEAHEAWEGVWHAAGHDSPAGAFLQGLIQASAALLKRHQGVEAGARRLVEKSFRRLDRVEAWLAAEGRPPGHAMGLDLPHWRRRLTAYVEGAGAPFPFLLLGEERSGRDRCR